MNRKQCHKFKAHQLIFNEGEEIRPVDKGGLGARPPELSKCTFVPL